MSSKRYRQRRATEFEKFLTTFDKTVPAALDIHPDLGQPRHPQDPPPSVPGWPDTPLPPARHPHRLLLAQPGRTLVRHLTEQKIQRGAHKGVQSLEADIRSGIADWNSNPRPFVWTKTAEKILDSLARLVGEFRRRTQRA
ncbi:hypothetical protein [Salinispora arenicola]|uniref:hypothetical protein n=1 Tax=Salinispora arenicola TaxID=168697 RepID=UPI0027DB37CC|nr:hypothetical protein [Salinispora arenicola]